MFFTGITDYNQLINRTSTNVVYKQGEIDDDSIPAIPDIKEEVGTETLMFLWLRRLKYDKGLYTGDIIHAIFLASLEVYHQDPFEIPLNAEIITFEDIKRFEKSDVYKNDIEPLL